LIEAYLPPAKRFFGLALVLVLWSGSAFQGAQKSSSLELNASTLIFTHHGVAENFGGAYVLSAADMDGDLDIDLLAASQTTGDIAWWENDGSGNFREHLLDSTFYGLYTASLVDLDGDLDIDILGGTSFEILWWENDGNQAFVRRTIAPSIDNLRSLFVVDLDNDKDNDLLAAVCGADEISWWENNGAQEFSGYSIDDTFDCAWAVYAVDLDGDGDMDVLAAAEGADEIAWWENDGNQHFTKQSIDSDFLDVRAIFVADLDGDEDVDVLGAASYGDEIAWWENDGSQKFIKHIVAAGIDDPRAVLAADLDNDGDMDVLGNSAANGDVMWWENDGAQNFTGHTIDGNFAGAQAIVGVDIDGDVDLDVAGAAGAAVEIAWWEQEPTAQAIIAKFPYSNGFEAGQLGAEWTVTTVYAGRVQVSNADAYGGIYSLQLDAADFSSPDAQAAAILNIDLSGQSQVVLDFWWREFYDENHLEDGVFISPNGLDWYAVLSFNDGPTTWRHERIDLRSEAERYGLSLNDHFQIKFQFRGNLPIASDGYAIDEVRIDRGEYLQYLPAIFTDSDF
jgi:hypothetical protein